MASATARSPAPSALMLRMGLSQRLGEGALELPLLPRVAGEVLNLTMSDDTNAGRLAQLIQQDPALASHVLRVVNSPAYGGAAKVVSLQQAVARLGLSNMREIAVTIAMQAMVMDDNPALQKAVVQLWRSALCTGLWAKELARSIRGNVEVAYLCGLLRDVGIPVLLNAAPADDLAGMDPWEAITAVTPLAAQAGAQLTKAWHLPEQVMASQLYREEPEAAGAHRDAAVTAAAAALFAQHCLDNSMDVDLLAADPLVAGLNLYPDDVATLVDRSDSMRGAADGIASAA